MQLFYLPDINSGTQQLSKEEARHIVQVLRKKVGDEIQAVDGKGKWYKGIITAIGKKHCTADFQLFKEENQRLNYRLTIAVSVTKNRDRFEWFLEKATEIGVDVIVPLYCKRTERTKVNLERWEKIVVAAMKQSLQAWKPELQDLTSFKDFLKQERHAENRFIGWCDEEVQHRFIDNCMPEKDVTILIGPEGDFTEEEVKLAMEKDFQPISLGKNRFRTETAGITATHLVSVLNELKENKKQ